MVSLLRWSWVGWDGPLGKHKPPTSFGKGRGSISSSLMSEGTVVVSMDLTSLSRGEGLMRQGLTVNIGGEGKGCGWRKVRE